MNYSKNSVFAQASIEIAEFIRDWTDLQFRIDDVKVGNKMYHDVAVLNEGDKIGSFMFRKGKHAFNVVNGIYFLPSKKRSKNVVGRLISITQDLINGRYPKSHVTIFFPKNCKECQFSVGEEHHGKIKCYLWDGMVDSNSVEPCRNMTYNEAEKYVSTLIEFAKHEPSSGETKSIEEISEELF